MKLRETNLPLQLHFRQIPHRHHHPQPWFVLLSRTACSLLSRRNADSKPINWIHLINKNEGTVHHSNKGTIVIIIMIEVFCSCIQSVSIIHILSTCTCDYIITTLQQACIQLSSLDFPRKQWPWVLEWVFLLGHPDLPINIQFSALALIYFNNQPYRTTLQ